MNCMQRRLQIWKRGLLNLPARYAGDLWAVEVWNVILRILIETSKTWLKRLHTMVVMVIMIMTIMMMTTMIMMMTIMMMMMTNDKI